MACRVILAIWAGVLLVSVVGFGLVWGSAWLGAVAGVLVTAAAGLLVGGCAALVLAALRILRRPARSSRRVLSAS